MLDITVKHSLVPISQINYVEEIVIVRDFPGPKIKKVRYVCPYPWLRKYIIIRILSKQFLMIYLGIKLKPDLIISYYLKAYGIIALITGKVLSIPVNYNVMSGPEEFQMLKFGNVGTYSIDKKDIKPPLMERILLSVTKRFDSITTTGSRTSDYLIRNEIEKNKILILPDSVDLDIFKPKDIDKEYDLITVARFDPIKRIDNLIKLTKSLTKYKPNIKVAIGGDGSEKENLKKLVKELELEDNIIFLGYIDNVQNFLQQSRIFVLTSEREGFPMTVLESMGCGLACIVSNVGDINDLIEDGLNSFIINDCNDIESYKKRVEQLLDDDKLYNDISKMAIKTVREKFTYKNARNIWERIIKDLINHN